MRQKYMKLKFIITALSFAMIISCNSNDTKYKVRITAYNGNFTGTYTIDGDKFGSFEGVGTTAQVYLFEHDFQISDNMLIDVTPDQKTGGTNSETDVTNVTCRIYLDKDLVFDNYAAVTTTAPITFKYEPGASSNDTTN